MIGKMRLNKRTRAREDSGLRRICDFGASGNILRNILTLRRSFHVNRPVHSRARTLPLLFASCLTHNFFVRFEHVCFAQRWNEARGKLNSKSVNSFQI